MYFPAVFGFVVGMGMIGQWSLSAYNGQTPELKTEPIRIAFHLAAEFATALGLIAASVGLIFGSAWAKDLFLVASGMLIYTAIVSPGYFVQRRQRFWLVIFGVLIVLDIALIVMAVPL